MLEYGLSDYLLEEMEVQKEKGNWVNLFRLIFLVQKLPMRKEGKWISLFFPRNKFTPLLCDLLDNYRYTGFMETVADALIDVADERAIKSIVNALNYKLPDDSNYHFNRKLLYALSNIDTEDAKQAVKTALTHRSKIVRRLAKNLLGHWDS